MSIVDTASTFSRGTFRGNPSQGILASQYSGVDVYELHANNTACMKRRRDQAMNATHILKVAGIEKTQRTKIIERQVFTGNHEKVQGGYGKYQGTWVPLDRGARLCKEFGVYDVLRPLIAWDPDGVVGRDGRPLVDTVLTELDADSGADGMYRQERGGRGSDVHRVKRAKVDGVSQVHGGGVSMLKAGFAHSGMPGSSPYAQRPREPLTTPSSTLVGSPAVAPPTGTFTSASATNGVGATTDIIPDMLQVGIQRQVQWLQSLFLRDPPPRSALQHTTPSVMEFTTPPPDHLDPNLPLDEEGNTALHYAAAMAHLDILRWLLHDAHADVARVNARHETALHRAVLFTACYDRRVFPELVHELASVFAACDELGRTALHHAAIASRLHGRAGVARYYVAVLLSHIVAHSETLSGVVDIRDRDGNTALCLAANVSARGVMELLIKAGADKRLRNYAGIGVEDYEPVDGFSTGESEEDGIRKLEVVDVNGTKGSVFDAVLDNPPETSLDGTKASSAEGDVKVTAAIAKSAEVHAIVDRILHDMDDTFKTELDQKREALEEARRLYRVATRELTHARRKVEKAKEDAKRRNDMMRRIQAMKRLVGSQEVDLTSPSPLERLFPKRDPSISVTEEERIGEMKLRQALKAEKARIASDIASLKQSAADVQLEQKFRRLVSLCLRTREEDADELIVKLQRAAEIDGRGESVLTLETIEQMLQKAKDGHPVELPTPAKHLVAESGVDGADGGGSQLDPSLYTTTGDEKA